MSQPKISWKTIRSTVVYQSPWITLYDDEVTQPNGEPGKYSYVKGPPFVLTVAFDGERFILVEQYRYPLKQITVEVPGGGIDEGETPLNAAQREFEEETGFTAKKWTKIGSLLNPNEATIFLAEELETGQDKMNEDGIVQLLQPTRKELNEMIDRGEIMDSKTLACLFLFDRYLSRKVG